MKFHKSLLSYIVLAPIAFMTQASPNGDGLNTGNRFVHEGACNPYLPLWEHVPDGEPRVFEDPDNPGHFRIYLVGSHDVATTTYCGADIHLWSASVDDLSKWRDDGSIFTFQNNGKWDIMFAPDLVEAKDGNGNKKYYLYPHSRGNGREALVARSNRPDEPFEILNIDKNNQRAIPGSVMGFDPSVFVEPINDPGDPDYKYGFRAFGFWGFQRSLAAKLDPTTMSSLYPGSHIIPYFLPAGKGYGNLRHEDIEDYPNLLEGENPRDFNFFEASSIRKVGNKYVMVYSGYSGPEYGMGSSNSTLRYAYADSPLGPWKSRGVLVDSRAPQLSRDGWKMMATNGGHNTHGSLEQINGQWYVFYHRCPRNFGYARQGMVAPVNISLDENSVADGGRVIITGYDSTSPEKIKAVVDGVGNTYRGAEVTSEGFNIFGLDPYRFYPAGIACYLSNTQLQQDSWDVWDNNAVIKGIKNGDVIGFKYFSFEGLAADTLGLKAFQGTIPGNHTKLNVFLSSKAKRPYKIDIWLDAPSSAGLNKGKKIGEIVVDGKHSELCVPFVADVSGFVDGLNGKHALYLVGNGNDGETLFDLHGLGFSKNKQKMKMLLPPEVQIKVNGQKLRLPDSPTKMTQENGLTDFCRYDIDCMAIGIDSKSPKITASSKSKGVKIRVGPFDDENCIGVVNCSYKGQTKHYILNFSNR